MHATSSLRSLLLLTVASTAVAQHQSGPHSIADALPTSTYAAVQFGGLGACAEAAAHMPLGQVVRDFLSKVPTEVKEAHLEHGLDQAANHVQMVLQHAGVRPADVRALCSRPMAIAMGRLTIEGMGPSAALVVDQGNDAEAVQRCFAALLQMAMRMHEGLAVSDTTVGDAHLQQLQFPHGPVVMLGAVGNYFVVSNSRGYLAEMAAVMAGQAPGLGHAVDAAHALPAAPLAALAVNFARINESLRPHLPYEAEAWADALGIGALDGIFAATAVGPHGGVDVFDLRLGGSKKGLLKAISGHPVDLAFAGACSKNTVLFGAETVDLAAVLDAGREMLELLPASARDEVKKEFGRELRRGLRDLGTTPAEVDRIVRAFGSDLGYAVALEAGGIPKPEILLHLGVRDADTVGSLLQRFEALTTREAGIEWKTRRVGDHEVRFCNIQPPEIELQFSPCYALTGDSLWFASDTAALTHALRKAGGEDSLAAQPDFQELAAASHGASSVMHLRWFRGVEIGWRNVETLLYAMVDAHKDEIGFGSDALPDKETMAKALGCSSLIYRVDDHGMRCETRGPLTFGALVAGFGALADQVLDRAGGKIY